MKKLILAIVAILLVCLGLGAGAALLNRSSATSSNKNLIIYNWGDYIDPKLISKFEKQTGYHVIYETFDSNEAMFTKVRQGGTNYDIAVPSDYMVSKMKDEHLLDQIDTKKLSNYHYLNKRFLNQSFDPHNNYSVPYFWGTLGIIYNDKFIPQGTITKWDDLWNPKYRNSVLLVDSARDIMGMSLISLGYSMNTTNSVKLKLAQAKLNALSPNVKAILADELKMYMIQNEASLAVTWSGEAREMVDNNHHLHYVVPEQGSNLWFDNLVIPRTAKNKAAAYKFINFMLEPQNAAQNAEYIGYATPNNGALKLLPADIKDDKQFYPPARTIKNLQVFKNLPPKKVQEYNDLFLEFKMNTH